MHEREGTAPVRSPSVARTIVAAVALVMGLAACGGSGSEEAAPDAQAVVEELKSLTKGEILIKGSSPRRYGPYVLEPGGYVLRFQQPSAGDASQRLVVALESRPGSTSKPYALVVDSEDRAGSRAVGMSGKLYVNVMDAGGAYELRLTPKTS